MIACIPTKGRYSTKTYKLYEQAGINYLHFVEPQDYAKYNVPNKISIGANDMGIAYVRNYVLQYARDNGHRYIIMSDDDITDFGISVGAKCYTLSAEIWKYIYGKAQSLPFAIYGINYRQHAWHEKKHVRINSSTVEVCVLIDTSKVTWSYRKELDTKEDRDFVLQAIKYSEGCIKFSKLFYNCPALGKQKGGLYEAYIQNRDYIAAKKLCAEWHPYSEMIEKNGRIDVKVDMKSMSKYYKRIVQ